MSRSDIGPAVPAVFVAAGTAGPAKDGQTLSVLPVIRLTLPSKNYKHCGMKKCAAGSPDGQITDSIFSEAVPQATYVDSAHDIAAYSTQLARPMHLILSSATSNPQANRGSVPGRTANLPPRLRYPQHAGRCRTNSEGHNDLPPGRGRR